MEIDGIAYISKEIVDEYNFPIGTNIVLPVYDTEHLEQGGYDKICNYFDMTCPVSYASFEKNNDIKKYCSGSYIADVFYNKHDKEQYPFFIKSNAKTCKNYSENVFFYFDNYLSEQSFGNYRER